MPKRIHQKRHAALAATLGLALGVAVVVTAPADAQQQQVNVPTIQMDAGKIFEMAVDTQMGHPEYSWILTRDRKFINAQRAKFFQTRQTVPGTYVLDVNVQDTEVNQTEYHAFNIVVNPTVDTSRPRRQLDGDLKAVLVADPWNGSDTITLPPEGGIVKLDMSQSVGQIGRFSLDLDTGVDSDGDGNFENDKDNALTAGEKDATPLYVYMMPKDTPRRVILTVTDPDNTKSSKAVLNVSFGGAQASSQPGITPPVTPPPSAYGTIDAEKHGLTVDFGTRIDQDMRMSRELLFEWDFGDRGRSLLDNPTHTYLKSGIYDVKLTVQDIATSEVVLTAEDTIQVQPDQGTPPTPGTTPGTTTTTTPPPPAPSTATPGTTTKNAGFGSVIKVIMIVFFLIALAVAMFFVLKWLKNKTAGKLQETLDKMENTIVENQDKKDAEKKAPTMKLKKEKKEKKQEAAPKDEPPAPAPSEDELAQREKENSDLKTGESALASAPLAGADAPMPDWLKGAQGSPAPSPAEPAAPAAPEPQAQAPLAGADAPMPDWLKGGSAQLAEQTPPPAPAPVPAEQQDPAAIPDWLRGAPSAPAPAPAEAQPAATPAPAPAAAPAAANAEASVPDWLKPAVAPQPAVPAQAQPAAQPAQNDVPDWLKGGQSAPAKPAEAASPPAEQPPVPAEAAPVPDWLKGTPQQTPTANPATAPAPAAPQNDPAAIPDWLKGTTTTAEQKPAAPAQPAEPPPAEQPAEAPKRSVVSDLGLQPLKDVQANAEPTPVFVAERKPEDRQPEAKPAEPAPKTEQVQPEPPKTEPKPAQPAEQPKQAGQQPAQQPKQAQGGGQQPKQQGGQQQGNRPKQQNQGGNNQQRQNNQPKKQKQGGQQQGNKPNQQNGGQQKQKPQQQPGKQPEPKPAEQKPVEQKAPEAPAPQAADAPIAIIKAESISTEPPAQTGDKPKTMDIPKADA